jgi:hypothetical protein
MIETTPSNIATAARPKILLVEDDEGLRTILRSVLEKGAFSAVVSDPSGWRSRFHE